MRWPASARRPLQRGATSSMPNRSNSSVWSQPFGACLRTQINVPTVLPTKFRIRMARRRQARREDRAFARLACHRHVAAHHARELARDGKAQPCPSRKSYPRVFWSRLLASVLFGLGLWQNLLLHESGESELGKLESGNGRCRSV